MELPRFDGHLNFGDRPQKEGARRGPSDQISVRVQSRGGLARQPIGSFRADVAQSLGVSNRTLWYWVSANRRARKRADNPTTLSADDAAELKRLRKENAQQREDMEILRKAAAYFAKETLR